MWQEVISSKTYINDGISRILKNILKICIPMSLCALFSAMTKTIDALTIVRILKNLIGEKQAIIEYGILNGKVDTLVMLPFSFNIAFATALVPSISHAIAKKEINIAKKRISFSILITILIGVPCSIIMSFFSKEFLNLLFPNASSGSQMLMYSSWTIIFVVLIQTINGSLQGLGKVNIPVVGFAIGGVIKLIFNIILINIFGINGAIFSSIISLITTFIICFIELKKSIDIRFNINKFIIKPIIASIIMGIISKLLYVNTSIFSNQNIRLIFSILIGIIIYIFLIIVLKILSKEEIYMLPYGQFILKKVIKDKNLKTLENREIQKTRIRNS